MPVKLGDSRYAEINSLTEVIVNETALSGGEQKKIVGVGDFVLYLLKHHTARQSRTNLGGEATHCIVHQKELPVNHSYGCFPAQSIGGCVRVFGYGL